MENIEDLNEKKIDYETNKSKRVIIIKIGKILIGIHLVLLILAFSIYSGPREQQLFILIHSIGLIFVGSGVFLIYLAIRIRPQCANCRQKTVYSEESKQFYCKHCKKYF